MLESLQLPAAATTILLYRGPRQGERGNPAGRGSKGTVSEDGVEQEYIANLQKQASFPQTLQQLIDAA